MTYLKRIEFRLFKRLERFSFSCAPANILVGPNNAGKSSIPDALRIVQGIQRYSRRLRPSRIRTSRGEMYGYEIPDSSIPINIANSVFNYSDEDAIIDFVHENGNTLSVEINPSHITRAYIQDIGYSIGSGRTYFSNFPLDTIIVPTLSPFEIEEEYVADDTVERHRAGRLASRHFRNSWYRSTKEDFEEFQKIVSDTWAGVIIKRPERPFYSKHLEMFFQESHYEREISWAGFGFQVWLQIVTHMLRGNPNSIFVLDEPDIYLHPDLQRKLLEIVRERFGQFFLATHSTEIINTSKPGDIVSINSKYRSGKRIRSDDEYNQVYSYIGSIENVELSKLSRAKLVIFFEGKDKALLLKLSEKAGYRALSNDGETLVIGVGGFGQWKRVVEAAWTFRNVLQIEVKILAVFDRDYRDDREVLEILSQVSAGEVLCSIWDRNEIENYLLVESALKLAITKRLDGKGIDYGDVVPVELIEEVSELFKHDVYGQYVGNTVAYERKIQSGKDSTSVASDCSRRL